MSLQLHDDDNISTFPTLQSRHQNGALPVSANTRPQVIGEFERAASPGGTGIGTGDRKIHRHGTVWWFTHYTLYTFSAPHFLPTHIGKFAEKRVKQVW